MYSHVLTRARVVDAASPRRNQVVDICVAEGRIARIAPPGETYAAAQVFDAAGACVSPGWVGVGVALSEPGHEQRDTLATTDRSARAGGFCELIFQPDSLPAVDTGTVLQALMAQPADVKRHFMAAAARGKDLTEAFDLRQAGAVAFYAALQDSGQMLRTLQYLRMQDALLVVLADDASLSAGCSAGESATSAMLGLRAAPLIAESAMVARWLHVLEYTGGRLHFSPLTTARSVELVAAAQRNGLHVSADTAPHYLCLDDTCLMEFDTNYKVFPFLRPRAEVEALQAAVLSGVIEVIAAHHQPRTIEEKQVEFDYALPGMLSLETAFALLNAGWLDLERLMACLTSGPRRVFGLPPLCIDEGQRACLTVFDPAEVWTFEQPASLSRNTPFIGRRFTGRVRACFGGA